MPLSIIISFVKIATGHLFFVFAMMAWQNGMNQIIGFIVQTSLVKIIMAMNLTNSAMIQNFLKDYD